MKTYFIGERIVEFETDSLKAAKAWATRNRYYLGRLRVPDIYIRLLDGRVELAAVGEYNRQTGRTKRVYFLVRKCWHTKRLRHFIRAYLM